MIRYIDGFETYPTGTLATTSAGVLGRWDLCSITCTNASPRYSDGFGPNYLANTNRTQVIGKNFGANEATGLIGMAFNPGTSGTNAYRMNLITLFDGGVLATAGNVQLNLVLNNDLTLSLCRNAHGTVLGTSTLTLTAGQWHYVELKWSIADSVAAGAVEVMVGGVSFLTLAATTDTKHTANAFATGFALTGNVPAITGAGTSPWQIDDVYWADLTGGVNDDFLGDRRVVAIRPSGNGNSSDMVGSDADSTDNYLLVDDNPGHDSDTTFVGSATVGDHDSYAMSDLPGTTNEVTAVQVVMNAKKTDTGSRSINSVVRIGSTDYDGSAKALTDSYTAHLQVYDQSPATAAAWGVSEVNGMEAGVKVQA